MYYKDVCGVMLCYDLTDVDSFNNLEFWINDLKTHAPANIVKVLIGNKFDVLTDEDQRRVPLQLAQ